MLANHESHQKRPPKFVLEPPERSRHNSTYVECSEVVDGGTLAAAAPVEEGGGGTSPEDAPLGPEGLALK